MWPFIQVLIQRTNDYGASVQSGHHGGLPVVTGWAGPLILVVLEVMFFYLLLIISILGFPGDINGKEPTCQCRRHRRRQFELCIRKIPWRRAWQPTPVFLPGESHRQRSLAGYSPQSCKELDTTDVTLVCMHVSVYYQYTDTVYYIIYCIQSVYMYMCQYIQTQYIIIQYIITDVSLCKKYFQLLILTLLPLLVNRLVQHKARS